MLFRCFAVGGRSATQNRHGWYVIPRDTSTLQRQDTPRSSQPSMTTAIQGRNMIYLFVRVPEKALLCILRQGVSAQPNTIVCPLKEVSARACMVVHVTATGTLCNKRDDTSYRYLEVREILCRRALLHLQWCRLRRTRSFGEVLQCKVGQKRAPRYVQRLQQLAPLKIVALVGVLKNRLTEAPTQALMIKKSV